MPAQAFLTSPKLVGRDEASAFAAQAPARARRRGRGSAAVRSSRAPGLGRSRMLASFVLEAKLMGAAAIAIDADRGRVAGRSRWRRARRAAARACCR